MKKYMSKIHDVKKCSWTISVHSILCEFFRWFRIWCREKSSIDLLMVYDQNTFAFFPQHLCYGSPFLLSLSVSCLIVGNDLSGPPRATRAPLLFIIIIIVVLYPGTKKVIYNIGTKNSFLECFGHNSTWFAPFSEIIDDSGSSRRALSNPHVKTRLGAI